MKKLIVIVFVASALMARADRICWCGGRRVLVREAIIPGQVLVLAPTRPLQVIQVARPVAVAQPLPVSSLPAVVPLVGASVNLLGVSVGANVGFNTQNALPVAAPVGTRRWVNSYWNGGRWIPGHYEPVVALR